MQTQDFKIVYDILQEGYGIAPYFLSVALIVVTIFFYFQIVSLFEGDFFKKTSRDILPVIFLPLMMCGLALGTVNIFLVRNECLELAGNGNVSVTEGIVKNLVRTSKRESFSVNNHSFTYSKHDLTKCGFNQNSGFTVSEGMKVRISFAAGCILKLEVSR